MICRLCIHKEECVVLCPMLEEFVAQGEHEQREILIGDLVGFNYEDMPNRFEDIYSHLNDTTELDELTFENFDIPLRQRQCIELYYFQNRTIAEIGILLHIRPITVKVLKLRGVKRIAENLGMQWKRIKESVRKPKLFIRPRLFIRPKLVKRVVNILL